MKKVGILGGTFDPIHLGHTELARSAMREYGLDEVRVMTGGMPPHKRDKKITSAHLRHAMTELALQGEKNIIADSFEVNKKEYTYTAKTLTELKKINPDWEIYFIMGEDSLFDFPKWYEPQTIVKKCILLVYPRDNNSKLGALIDERKKEYDADIRPITSKIVDISSTIIRERVSMGESIKGLVTEDVEKFIKEKGLYR